MPLSRVAAFLIAAVLSCSALAQESGQQQVQQPSQANPVDTSAPVPGQAPTDALSHPSAPLPPVTPPNRPVIGLALEGGGALGLAHIGVIQWFEDNRIPIDRIAGTSMGALVGAAYSTGHTPDQMRVLATSGAFTSVFALQTPYVDSSFRRRQDRRQTPSILTFGLSHGPELRDSILDDRGINEFLATNLFGYNRRDLDYNNLPIPFRCVVTDLNTLQSLTFSNGPMSLAVRASISIPGIFPPVRDSRGHYLADGGILDNLPTGVVRRDLHAEVVIAIRLQDAPLSNSDISSIVGVLNRAFSAGIVQNVEQSLRHADVVVTVPVASYSSADYTKGGQLIREGYLAAEANRAILSRYALNSQDWAAYMAVRRSRQLPPPGVLREVRVEGGQPGARREVEADMQPLKGQPITPEATLNALKPVQSNGGYGANYETFSPPAPAPTALSPATAAKPDASAPDTGVIVHLSQDPTGPPYLLLGPDLAASTSNITRMELNTRLVDQNLGGFGSELRATARLGFMTDLSAEYYRLLTPSGFFIEPRIGIVREPVYIWANQKRAAERFLQNLDAAVEAGRTIGYSTQISAEWRVEITRWRLTTGSGGGPYVSGTAQVGLLHIDIDHETSSAISPQGFRLSAAAGAMVHAAGSANAPLVQLSAAHTWLWRDKNIFGLTGDVNSYLRANVAQPYRFTLGGPRRLSASSFDEYRGTDTYLARAGYLRQIAKLPTGLGQGLFAIFGYEAGEIWSPESHAILRQDGTFGLLGATPLGSITVGGSVGDAGHRKVFITIGRLF